MPHIALRPYIEWYWLLKMRDQGDFRQELFVSGQVHMLFNYGAQYERYSRMNQSNSLTTARSCFYGQCDEPMGVLQQGDICIVGVAFRPGGLAAFSQVPVYEFTNEILSPQDVFGQRASILEAQLYDHLDEPSCLPRLLNEFFLSCLSTRNGYETALHIATLIEGSAGVIRIEEISHELGYSTRSVNRFFRQFYGIPPVMYGRLMRFQQALALLEHTTLSISHIAHQCAYTDASHLHRDFRLFTGYTPRQHRTKRQQDLWRMAKSDQ